ncbi:RasGEF domain-containing protein [Colletotrichum higginsianum IMI 349063]|uniref:RasGEF domain-containing protein n=1 Tax=Colletotrichum higginsianum (strain IMI 349063) TaxID=759273 RepID=A0A1B7XV48_COLHI|nr:RasGEF domain-containing protein [Colletotrichum higginsianum IMI 349063]OBR03631.1 RasGEF domain-containing protein [Colletotrichum higginsianum IMI 349063]
MASDRMGARKAHRSSEGSHFPPKHYYAERSTAADAAPSSSSSPRRADRDAAHRSAPAAPKRHTPHYAVHRESSIEPLRPSEQSASYRDSIVSIVDDPFFLRFDDHNIEAALAFDSRWTTTTLDSPDDDDDDQNADDEEENEANSQGNQDGESAGSDLDSLQFRDEDTPNERWPPPRRESLIIGHSLYWVMMPHQTQTAG